MGALGRDEKYGGQDSARILGAHGCNLRELSGLRVKQSSGEYLKFLWTCRLEGCTCMYVIEVSQRWALSNPALLILYLYPQLKPQKQP